MGSQGVLVRLAFIQMLTDKDFNPSSVMTSELLICFYVEGRSDQKYLYFEEAPG